MILRNYQVFNRFNILYRTEEKVGIDMWAPDQTIKVYRRGVVSSEKEGGEYLRALIFFFLINVFIKNYGLILIAFHNNLMGSIISGLTIKILYYGEMKFRRRHNNIFFA